MQIVGFFAKAAIAAAIGAAVYHWYTPAQGRNAVLVILTGMYLGLALYWGRHTVRRLTKGHGGLVVLGGAGISKQPDVWLIVGIIFGLFLWLLVGIISAPIELALCVVQFVRLSRTATSIRRQMPHPILAT